MYNLNDLRTVTYVFAVAVVLLFVFMSGIAHCTETTDQSTREVISMYIKRVNPKLDANTRHRIAASIVRISNDSGIPYEVITAIMQAESSYDPNAIGPVGEIGLMQIYDKECAGIPYDRERLFNIEYNIAAGVCKLIEKLALSGGDIMEAIRRYNGSGPGADRFQKRVRSYILDIIRFRVAMNERA